jgi:hypothetical protein
MPNDPTATPYETAIANTHNWISQTHLTRHHPSRQRNILSNHGVVANMNVLLVENCCHWKTDDAIGAKLSKFLTSGSIWAD